MIISVGKQGSDREVQECHTLPTLAAAKAKQAEIRSSRHRKTLIRRDNLTFDELCQQWLASRQDVREVTVAGYRDGLKVVREQIGRRKVQDVDRGDIENVIRKLVASRKSHRTIAYKLGIIKQVLDYGVSAGYLSVNVASSVKVPRRQHSKAPGDLNPRLSRGLRMSCTVFGPCPIAMNGLPRGG